MLRNIGISIAAAALLVTTGCAVISSSASAESGATATAQASSKKVSAKKLLKKIPVADEFYGPYERDAFIHWTDREDDGCDARDEVFLQESLTYFLTGPGCTMDGGKWKSRFDGMITTDPSIFDVDHMVPLAEAYGSGAYTWTSKHRELYANDYDYPFSLNAVTASSNRSKSDSEPREWMPPKRNVACWYVSAWVAVKYRWGLSVDQAEKKDLTRRIAACNPQNIMILRPSKM